MISSLVVGAAMWLVVAAVGPRLAHGLPPAVATRLLVSAAVVVAGSGLLVGGLVAATWLARLPEIGALGPWSAVELRTRTPVPVAVAVVAAGAVVVSVGCAGIVLRRRLSSLWLLRRAYRGMKHANGLIVLDDDRPDAYSTSPPGGRVLITAGLLRCLQPAERRVLLAHEASHLRHGHVWSIMAADLAAAVNPILVPTARAVRRAVERWADEDAAADVGDRVLVARTLARTALLVHGARPRVPALGAAAGGVPQRVSALLEPPPRHRPLSAALLVTMLLTTAAAALLVQRDVDEFFDQAHIATYGVGVAPGWSAQR